MCSMLWRWVPWDPGPPYDPERPTLPPQLTYKDATYLAQSDIPRRKIIMTQLLGMLERRARSAAVPLRRDDAGHDPGDHFLRHVFETSLPEYRAAGARGAISTIAEIVLTKQVNDGFLSVCRQRWGRSILWNRNRFRVAGVRATGSRCPDSTVSWSITPSRRRATTTQVYMPFRWVPLCRPSR